MKLALEIAHWVAFAIGIVSTTWALRTVKESTARLARACEVAKQAREEALATQALAKTMMDIIKPPEG